ncbi:DUF1648 domain-containing protein [[Phormidium] sp. ETS-05]|uniref:DUF1648 domain-containing protein n=1 Tax=[Phormidium] sp. ETS-05 TaxID=222819 RepID=UPI0018EEF26E|nr:DUF1648 domain-containing protein [[Phormidium] sp. ETS-05]
MNNRRDRPVIIIGKSAVAMVLELAAVAATVANIGMVLWFWAQLPPTIPIHFGIGGYADLFGPKITILILPAVAVFSYILMTLVSRHPHTWNYPVPITPENAERQYKIGMQVLLWMKTQMLWMLVFVVWQMIWVAVGKATTVNVAAIFALLGVVLGTSWYHLRQAKLAR